MCEKPKQQPLSFACLQAETKNTFKSSAEKEANAQPRSSLQNHDAIQMQTLKTHAIFKSSAMKKHIYKV